MDNTQAPKKPFNKAFLWWGLGAIALIASLWILVALSTGSSSSTVNIKIPPVTKADFQSQPASVSAKTTLVEYADFQCPTCAAYYPLLKQLQKDFGSNLNVVYRLFPLKTIHQNAFTAAKAAYAASKQGKFWEMHDKLFEKQNAWSILSDPEATFISYAKDLGLDTDRFKNDYESGDTFSFVNNAYNEDVNIGLNGTPTFFLNGKLITNPQSYADFKQVIQSSIK